MNVRNRPKLIATGVGLAFALLAAEVGIRFIMFGGIDAGWSLRRPSRFADYQTEEDYFKLASRWKGDGEPKEPKRYHPTLGWVSAAIDPDTLRHRVLGDPRGRQRIALYGDSYAQCVTPAGFRFEDYIQRSPGGAETQFLNYGVSGFGLDQVALLLEKTIDDVASAKDSVTLIGVFVDDDLDRCMLDMRGFPKPRFERSGTALSVVGIPIPPLADYLEENPLSIRSYAWRFLCRSVFRNTPLGATDHSEEAQGLATAIANRLIDQLESRSLSFGFVLFEGNDRTASVTEVNDWRMRTMVEVLKNRSVNYIKTRRFLREHALSQGVSTRSLFGQRGELADHFTAEGNEVVARALMLFAEGLTRNQ